MKEDIKAQHLAIFNPPFLDLILEGKKTIEGRFSKVKCAPFKRIKNGDVVLMKDSGGLVRGAFTVKSADTFESITKNDLSNIKNLYGKKLNAEVDPEYWEKRKDSRYATLIHVASVQHITKPFHFPKKDRRGWVVINKTGSVKTNQLPLFKNKTQMNRKYDPYASRCNKGLHAFFKSSTVNEAGNPTCRSCKADCINWELLHQRNDKKMFIVFRELRKEKWRDDWFKCEIDPQAKNHAFRKGLIELKLFVEKRLRNSVGASNPYRDGIQTPYAGNIVYYAQHAVAACCRNCLETWHGIPKGKELTNQNINYLTELVMKYVKTVMPELTKEGTSITNTNH